MVVQGRATALSDIDEQWLTAALEQAGATEGARVVAMSATPIGTGQVGENVRFDLVWSQSGPHPMSVVGKFPSTSEVSLAAAAATETYIREVGFYRDVQDRVSVPCPRVYRLEEDLDANQFVLLMEDITPARVGDQLTGCSVDDARLALEAIAPLHADTWGRVAEFAHLGWVGVPSPEGLRQRVELVEALWPGFEERYRTRLDPADLEQGRWLRDHVLAVGIGLGHCTGCLTHNDFRLDNLLFGEGPGSRPVTVVDWQTIRPGVGVVDVAYFLGAGLLPELRREHEEGLLAHYAGCLRAAGVVVSDDELGVGYRLGSTSGYLMAIVASQLVQQTERGDEMFLAMASRHADQMRAMDVASQVG